MTLGIFLQNGRRQRSRDLSRKTKLFHFAISRRSFFISRADRRVIGIQAQLLVSIQFSTSEQIS